METWSCRLQYAGGMGNRLTWTACSSSGVAKIGVRLELRGHRDLARISPEQPRISRVPLIQNRFENRESTLPTVFLRNLQKFGNSMSGFPSRFRLLEWPSPGTVSAWKRYEFVSRFASALGRAIFVKIGQWRSVFSFKHTVVATFETSISNRTPWFLAANVDQRRATALGWREDC